MQRILVIRFSSLGDVVLSTSPLNTIRNSNPYAKITFLTLSTYAPILENHPDIDRLLTIEKSWSINNYGTLVSIFPIKITISYMTYITQFGLIL